MIDMLTLRPVSAEHSAFILISTTFVHESHIVVMLLCCAKVLNIPHFAMTVHTP